MAASLFLTPAQADLVSSLSQDEIPIKLRCAICSKLAINAFKLPCCDQAICESCQSTLPTSCPVCEHSPLSADDCKPNKALRTTIKLFVRTEEKKREAPRSKDAQESAPPTPIDPKPDSQRPAAPAPSAGGINGDGRAQFSNSETATPQAGAPFAKEESQTDANDSVDAPERNDADSETRPTAGQDTQAAEPEKDDEEASKEDAKGEDAQPSKQSAEDGEGTTQMSSNLNPSFGLGNGGFSNMNFGGADMNQMQMMMAMQNGMMPSGFGGFSMMGMPGMDPMMYMNGNFGPQGVGMHSMGMGGFNGGGGMGVGSGSNDNWQQQQQQQQQSWNGGGQDNFSHPNASGMSNGDYGNNLNSAGFNSGYNQGNYGHQNQYTNYRQNNFHRGGRGGRGRGYFNNGNNVGYGYGRGGGNFGYGGNGFSNGPANEGFQNHQNGGYNAQQHFSGQGYGQGMGMGQQDPSGGYPAGQRRDSAAKELTGSGVDEFGRNIRPASQKPEGDGGAAPDEGAKQGAEQPGKSDNGEGQGGGEGGAGSSMAGNGVSDATGASNGPTTGGNKASDDVLRPVPALSDSYGAQFTHRPGPTAPDVPLNAPSGPKAMRQGLPNTSLLHLKARGLIGPDDSPQNPMMANGQASPVGGGGDKLRSRSGSLDLRRNATADQQPGDGGRDSKDDRHNRSRRPSRERDRNRELRDRDPQGDVTNSTEERDDHRERDRRGARSISRSSRTLSRSRDRKEGGHKRSSRRHRSGSPPATADGGRSSHRHGPKDSISHGVEDEPKSARSRDGKFDDLAGSRPDSRLRSASPDDSRRSGHRSSRRERDSERRRDRDKKDRDRERDRDRDRDRERDRDRDRDRDWDRGRDRHKTSSRRDRDHDRDKGRDRAKDRGKDRDTKDRERARDGKGDRERGNENRDRERDRHRHRENRSAPSSAVEAPPSAGGKARSFEIKGVSSKSATGGSGDRDHASRRESQVSASGAATAVRDVHAEEREKRNRERLMKEAQKLAGLAGGGGGGSSGNKRSRGGGDDGGDSSSKRSRRKGRRGEAVSVGDEEDRMRRLEAEREEARWK
ncbi:hypothetical protein RB595_009053 [Gaeumannomyces hyphopodioides]